MAGGWCIALNDGEGIKENEMKVNYLRNVITALRPLLKHMH